VHHLRSDAYSAELDLRNKHQIWGGAPKLDCYPPHFTNFRTGGCTPQGCYLWPDCQIFPPWLNITRLTNEYLIQTCNACSAPSYIRDNYTEGTWSTESNATQRHRQTSAVLRKKNENIGYWALLVYVGSSLMADVLACRQKQKYSTRQTAAPSSQTHRNTHHKLHGQVIISRALIPTSNDRRKLTNYPIFAPQKRKH